MLFKYGFKRKYEGFGESFFRKGLHAQLAAKLFYLKTFMVYGIYIYAIGSHKIQKFAALSLPHVHYVANNL